MPAYSLICQSETCRHTFEDFHPIKADHPACPRCGGPTENNIATIRLRDHNRVFTDTLSREFGFHPDEVGEVRAMLGQVGNCINADGDVNFATRSEERAFRSRYKEVRAANEARVAEDRQADAEAQASEAA